MMELPIDTDPACCVCRLLRSKGTPGVTYDDAVSWEAGFVSTATYWCLATTDQIGPDDGFVHPHACTPGRICHQGPKSNQPAQPL
jgi:hypothetical protein